MKSDNPVTLNMKVGDILKHHPELLKVLVAQSPHFERLKNPILRRIHGHLVTLAQAAAIAELDPVVLVRNLNAAIGQDAPPQETVPLKSMAGTPTPTWMDEGPVAVELDVREFQQKHEDPFSVIMAAVSKVEEGQILRLRNTFEPLPLYDVLGKRGFAPWARQIGLQDWEVFFFKSGGSLGSVESEAEANCNELDEVEPSVTVTIDVKDLTPPQPMMLILDALNRLKTGEVLLVHHIRRPAYLYPRLAELGFSQKTVEKGPGKVDLYIRKQL